MKSNIRRVKDELDYLEDSIGEVLKILEDNSLTDHNPTNNRGE